VIQTNCHGADVHPASVVKGSVRCGDCCLPDRTTPVHSSADSHALSTVHVTNKACDMWIWPLDPKDRMTGKTNQPGWLTVHHTWYKGC